jgi:RNA polymerase sigma factor (sigma-70 family)
MQSPPSSQTSPTKRPAAPAPATGFRARLEQVYERLLPQIRRHLAAAGLGRAGDLDDQAQEVLQEVMVEALSSESKYDPARDLRAWLNGIEGKVVLRHMERFGKARRRLPPEEPGGDQDIEARFEQIVQAASGRESTGPDEALARRQEVEAALAPLPEQHREVLILYYFEHHQDNDALAAALGIKPGAARVRLCRAHDAARKGGSR